MRERGVREAFDRARSAAASALEAARAIVADAGNKLGEAMPRTFRARDGGQRMTSFIRAHPVTAAAGALAVGFLLGALLPRTTIESERMRDVRRMARDVSIEAVEAGKQMIRETIWMTFGPAGPDDAG